MVVKNQPDRFPSWAPLCCFPAQKTSFLYSRDGSGPKPNVQNTKAKEKGENMSLPQQKGSQGADSRAS